MCTVELKTSNIPKSGNGLFATANITKGTKLGEYIGKRFSPNKILSGVKEIYSFSTNSNVMISPFDDCLFKYANDIVNLEQSLLEKKLIKYSNLNYNIDWHIDKKLAREAKELLVKFGDEFYRNKNFLHIETVDIIAIKDIKIGEELYIDYDKNYWISRITKKIYRVRFPPISGEALCEFLEKKNNSYWKRLKTEMD